MTPPRPRPASPASAAALGSVLALSGVLHLVVPRVYEPLIPRPLGNPRAWVLGSGVAELACAAALVPARTRNAGALATAALLVAVFPGNVTMALRTRRGAPGVTARRVVAWARLPLQVPLVGWALAVARGARAAAAVAPAAHVTPGTTR
jgi:uncharacterized membrane protein